MREFSGRFKKAIFVPKVRLLLTGSANWRKPIWPVKGFFVCIGTMAYGIRIIVSIPSNADFSMR